MSDELYMSDPRHHTIEGYIASLEIFGAYADEGRQTQWFFDAEHDQLWAKLTDDQLPPDSEDGRRLSALGWLVEDDMWVCFT